MGTIEIVEPRAEMVSNPDWLPDFARLCEEAGRESHRSEGAMTEKSYDRFIRKIAFKLGHESIIEHAGITMRFVGSRTMSHQLVRHRIAAYTQESQRYCDYSHPKWGKTLQVICPPSIGIKPGFVTGESYDSPSTVTQNVWRSAMLYAYQHYLQLRDLDIPAEDARFVLPGAARTSVVTTFNFRQWRHFFRTRCDSHAQWEIRKLAQDTLRMFMELLPCCFDDQAYLLEAA